MALSYADRSTPERRPIGRKPAHPLLFMVLVVFVAPLVPRLVKMLGFHQGYRLVWWMTIAIGLLCIVGIVIGFRSARAQASRDTADLQPGGQSDQGE
jgi:hypothetical protein